MKSDAASPEAYIAEQPPERQEALKTLRQLILDNLPDGYVEAMNWGMIAYEVPMETSGPTYNGKPLMYAALGSQKNHMAVYLCGLYCVPGHKEQFIAAYEKAGNKLDMGAACVRFKNLDGVHLDAVAEAIASVPVADFVAAAPEPRRKHSKPRAK